MDAGNSRLKWSIQRSDTWSSVSYADYCVATRLAVTLKILVRIKPSFIMMAHVLGRTFEHEIRSYCERNAINLTIVHAQAVGYGIKNAYHQASKLGTDRFVGLVAVHHKNNKNNHRGRASIIVSCGTAVTIDAINKEGEHLGGVILPGLQLWRDALIKGTELLQQADESDPSLFATSTGQGIATGSLYGLAGAIDRVCNEMKQVLSASSVTLVLTGGCAESLSPYLSNKYKLSPNLVIQGLKIITEFDHA